MRTVSFRPEASDDIDDEALYIGFQSRESGVRFIQAVLDTSARLGKNPGMGHPRSDMPDEYRAIMVRGFPNHIVVYRYDDLHLIVVRVLHGARDFSAVFGV